MAVKCLNPLQKEVIATSFLNRTHSIEELVATFRRSRRTIIRVLEEASIEPGIKRRIPKPTPLPQVIPTKRLWYRRIIGSFVQACH